MFKMILSLEIRGKHVLKDIELELISELMKNCRRSDRELAKSLHVTQPTVTRNRKRLEKLGLIEYSATPNLAELGYEIVAVVFGRRNYEKHPENAVQKAKDFAEAHPNIVFGADGSGLSYDRISVSIHKSYSDYAKFMQEVKAAMGEIMGLESFLINLKSEKVVRGLSLRAFAETLKRTKES
jgi:DNA-binding Lrp family transcriptional regulator